MVSVVPALPSTPPLPNNPSSMPPRGVAPGSPPVLSYAHEQVTGAQSRWLLLSGEETEN